MEENSGAKDLVARSEKRKTITERIRANPWIAATFVLGIVVIVFLFSNFSGGLTGNAVSGKTCGEQLLAHYISNGASGLSLDSVEEVSGIYKINFKYQGNIVPIYATKDCALTGSLSAFSGQETETESQEVPKSDKPKVELYVFTYCPYGLQMEKAMLPAVNLLGDKIDFKIRQIGAMHDPSGCSGDACYESTEAKRQICVEKNYPDKFLQYVNDFAVSTEIGACKGDASCLTTKLNALYSKLGIDASKINSCMTSEGAKLYDAEVANSDDKGVSGSPTVIINGVETQIGRNPDAVKDAICSAFSDYKVPSECSTKLSTTSPSAGFGASASSSSASSSASC